MNSESNKTLAYRKKLQLQHGGCIDTGKYLGQDVSIDHICVACGASYLASPRRMLSSVARPYCVKCIRAIHSADQSKAATDFMRRLEKHSSTVRCTEFVSMHRKSRFTCECGNSWEEQPKRVLKNKMPCPECDLLDKASTGEYSDEEINAFLSARQHEITCVGHGPKYAVHCGVCQSTWSMDLKGILQSGKQCPVCNLVEDEEVDKIMSEALGCEVLGGIGSIPVRYTFKNVGCTYWPRYELGSEIYEVRNSETLLRCLDRDRMIARAVSKNNKRDFVLLYHVNGEIHEVPPEWKRWKLDDARAYIREFEVKHLRILSMDPGVTNFAWSIVEAKRGSKFRVLATGMLHNTLKELTGNSRENTDMFRDEILQIMEEYSVDHMIMERFMSRGMKGLTIELVNAMIGILMGMWTGQSSSFKLLTAAQWKNEWNRRSDLKEFYETAPCEVHQVDAIGIGMYGAAFWLDEEPFLGIRQFEPKLALQIGRVNLEQKR